MGFGGRNIPAPQAPFIVAALNSPKTKKQTGVLFFVFAVCVKNKLGRCFFFAKGEKKKTGRCFFSRKAKKKNWAAVMSSLKTKTLFLAAFFI